MTRGPRVKPEGGPASMSNTEPKREGRSMERPLVLWREAYHVMVLGGVRLAVRRGLWVWPGSVAGSRGASFVEGT